MGIRGRAVFLVVSFGRVSFLLPFLANFLAIFIGALGTEALFETTVEAQAAEIWNYPIGEPGPIEPGPHTIECGGECGFSIPEGVVPLA